MMKSKQMTNAWRKPSVQSIAIINAVFTTLVQKFSQDFIFASEYVWDPDPTQEKYDVCFEELLFQNAVLNKHGNYLCMINTAGLRKVLRPKFAASCGKHDVLIEIRDDEGCITLNIEAHNRAQFVAIAENADELRTRLAVLGNRVPKQN